MASELDDIRRARLTRDAYFVIRMQLLARFEKAALSVSDLIVANM